MNIVGIIPARMGSTRFPGKPLVKILGMPMIGHVYLRSKMCHMLNGVYIATPDEKIASYITSIGGNVVMTADTHQRASDRTAEAMLKIEHEKNVRVDIVVMIQGDEPVVFPEMIEESVHPMLGDMTIEVVNLMASLRSTQAYKDPNEIKVVVDNNNFALYFSRAPIPTIRKEEKNIPMYKQVCIIPFRRDFLIKFNELNATPLEIAESIDMLRILEHGFRVKMVLTEYQTYSVDTIEDLRKVEKCMQKDPLFKKYQYFDQKQLNFI